MQIFEHEVQSGEALPATASMPMSWDSASANDEAVASYDVTFESPESAPDGKQLRLAVESKKRDNVALGETLVQIGLLGPREMLDLRIAQAGGEDLCNSLLVVSAIRSRLGEMLLSAKQITSAQLELALELQRKHGGLLGEILVSQGWLDRATLDAALAMQARSRQAA